MSDTPRAPDHLLLDACCIISLYASGRMGEILICMPYTTAVVAIVKEREALWIFAGPEGQETAAKRQIELQPMLDQGLLRLASFESEEERETFIEFTTALGDDGEAMSGALAAHRHWSVATDDGKATRFFRVRCPQVPIVSTLELVKYWADHQHVSDEEIRTALKNIRFRGRYKPHWNHALFGWWQKFQSS